MLFTHEGKYLQLNHINEFELVCLNLSKKRIYLTNRSFFTKVFESVVILYI
jgi:hypothetical protein